MTPAAPRPRPFLKIAAAVLVALAVLYLVIGNAVLPSVVRSIGRNAGVELQHGVLYTLYPGHVHVRDLRISDGAGGDWQVWFDSVDLRWKTLDLPVGRVRAQAGEVTLAGPVTGRIDLSDPRPLASSVRLSGGSVEGRALTVERTDGGAGRAPVQVDIDIHGGEISTAGGVAVSGAVRVRGGDAGVLLDVAGLEGAARWALARLEGQPFTLDASVSRRPRALVLDDVRLDSGTVQARGAYHRRGERREAAFLISQGRLVTGIAVEGSKVDVVLDPGEGWLARRLQALQSGR